MSAQLIAVKYKKTATDADRKLIEEKYGLTRTREIPALRIIGYSTDETTISKLRRETAVEYVEKEKGYGIT